MQQPILLKANHYTSLARTPWAGTDISQNYKDRLFPADKGKPVGESWEFSCDPAFASPIDWSAMGLDPEGRPQTLPALVAQNPEGVLSPKIAQGSGTCEILLKLLNPRDPLSLQVHPEDSDPDLTPDECGKPESWLVLKSEPGAGIYLGFSKGITKTDLRQLLTKSNQAKDILHFVPVEANDYFEIDPGIPHAIGPGVTLIEPQRIQQGKSGKTYRLWDWGRRYLKDGTEDPVNGSPRDLHLEEGLKLIDPEHQVGEGFVASLRRSPAIYRPAIGVEVLEFPSNSHYQTFRVQMDQGATLRLDLQHGYGAFTCLDGELAMASHSSPGLRIEKGRPALLPHGAMPLHVQAKERSDFVLVIPRGANLKCGA